MKFSLIPYPDTYSESEIQATLYSKLKELRFDVRLEVRAKDIFDIEGKRIYGVFDIVIFDKYNKEPLIIIETKKKRNKGSKLVYEQLERYKNYKIPVILCDGHTKIQQTINIITNLKVYHDSIQKPN